MKAPVDKEVIVRNITRAVSYKGLNLRHFNGEMISKLVYAGKLNSITDIFNLSFSDLIKYGGKETADKIIANPPKKAIPLPNFIYTLGLCFDDKDYQHKLAVKFTSLRSFFAASYKEIENVVGVELGLIIFENIALKKDLTKALYALNFHVEPFSKKHFNGMFEEKDIVISGRFEGYRQNDIADIIAQVGGIRAHTIRETTGFLLAGESDKKTLRDRIKKARELNVPIINHYQLKRLFRIYGIK